MSTIRALRGCAESHLRSYTDPWGPRAFRTYDRQGDPTRLSPLDCLAPALLSVRTDYKQVVPLFRPDGPGAQVLQAMEAVLADEACATADFLEVTLDPPTGAWSLVDRALVATGEAGGRGLPGFKAVAVTKILHRKRPRLVPIFDSSVYEFYLGRKPLTGAYRDTPRRLWPLLQADLRRHRDWIEGLTTPIRTPDERPLSLLRAADIIIWEHMATGCTA
ncbi:hypothetical protein GCM10023347_30290 [Streptomyces chumphonensis]|uniref:Uncharacterized protein n=1 Tax=Streptomyces chumphonensis TaxID=1214925 RepID=A0A927F143_9ACTN|nr:DUF6308 family protein [Streptomyces chumphonensis]MBD3933669.1 hypothetical protein [Streptomyces chumphonensis]